MTSPQISLVGTKSNDKCPESTRGRDTVEGDVTTEAEMTMMHLSNEEDQGLQATPEARRKRHGLGSPSQTPEDAHPAGTLVLDFQPPEL